MDHSGRRAADGSATGSALPNIQEELSEELKNSSRSLSISLDEGNSLYERRRRPSARLPFVPLTEIQQHSPLQTLPDSLDPTDSAVSSMGMGSSYSTPLSDGGESTSRSYSRNRFQRPKSFRHSFNFRRDDDDDDDDDDNNNNPDEGSDSSVVKRASSTSITSILTSPMGKRRTISRNSLTPPQGLSSRPSTSGGLRRSLSLGNNYSGQSNSQSPMDSNTSGGTMISALGIGAGSAGAFTSNLSRKSQNFRKSIARHSLARLGRQGSSMDDDGNALGGAQARTHRYNMGDSALITIHSTRWANCVNRHGYPPGGGTTSDEQRGPYIFVLGKVKTIHYEENAVFYTVTRMDTGIDVRGDPDFMEPILSKAGEEAARLAATEFAMGDALEDEDLDEADNTPAEGNDTAIKVVENILEVLLLPFFLLYDLFVFVIGARLFRWGEAIFIFSRRQAHSFLNGLSPYECAATITTVNLTVLCSIWYMFIDQARLAFFPTNADSTLAIVNFIIWSVLSVELMFEVFIRPDDYNALVQSEKAYTPKTMRYISGLHLVVELISLAFFVPEFLCLFQSDLECDERPRFSFLYSTLLAISGPTRLDSFVGRAFYACIRLRVFGLVRHWKIMWLNTKYLKREKQRLFEENRNYRKLDNSGKVTEDSEVNKNLETQDLVRHEQKQRNVALINASNIGTALMVTNSYRALTILVMIFGILPMITLIFFTGVVNPVAMEMIGQLQATNLLVTVENESNCQFLVNSVDAWARSLYPYEYDLITSSTDDFLIALVMQPSRCPGYFETLKVGNLLFQETPCSTLESRYHMELTTIEESGNCIVGALAGTHGGDLRSIAQNFDIRRGNLQIENSTTTISTLVLEDGSSFESSFKVSACLNQTHGIESSALASFVLQFCLLMLVLGGLTILRRDAEDLVLGPLRSMLKIVARYAKNPLSQAASSSKDNQSVLSDSESEASSHGSDGEGSEGDGFGTYETEQLITAVAKITDLLRKCWGVAGADIISTNLASREGALAEVFNPTVPGKSVYALFAFAAINGFDHALKCLGGDVMILINDVAAVLHGEVYRWGFGDSGQCNKNLGAAFLMVFRIGLVKEVVEKLEEAQKVVFTESDAKKSVKKKKKASPAHVRTASDGSKLAAAWARSDKGRSGMPLVRSKSSSGHEHDAMADAMKLSLQSLPGIATFTDRAVIGMLKSFAGIHRDNKLRSWSRDFRLSAGVGAFEVNMIFGMDAGWAVEGAVGSEYKIDATYLSPHVNMASRMMSACKHYGVTILLSETVQELMSENAKAKLRNVDRVTVKGSVRIQKIFTFDARHKGADFFLFSRSEELADIDANQYTPSIWNTDQDLQAMRHHVTDDFEAEFNAGMKFYYSGDWPAAIRKLENANEIMVDAAMEEGYLHDEMDDTPDRKELYRNETADGPCSYLVHFMKSKGGVAPEGWAGWHPLLSK